MEASAELTSVALADGTCGCICVALTVMPDCTDEAAGGTANATAYADGSPDEAAIEGPAIVVPAICTTALTST